MTKQEQQTLEILLDMWDTPHFTNDLRGATDLIAKLQQRIAKLESAVLPDEVQSLANNIRNNSHIDCVCYDNKTADMLERLARENAEYEAANDEDAEVMHLLQERIAELEAKVDELTAVIDRHIEFLLRLSVFDAPEARSLAETLRLEVAALKDGE